MRLEQQVGIPVNLLLKATSYEDWNRLQREFIDARVAARRAQG